jgi:MFS family permease
LATISTHFFFLGYHSSTNVLVPEALESVPVGLAGFVLGVFGFAGVIARPITGGLLDLGRHQLWLRIGGIATVIAFLGYSLNLGPWGFIPFRILHGTAMGFFATGLLALVAEALPSHRRGLGLGIFQTANTLSLFYGPLLMKNVAESFSLELAFLLGAISTGIALISAAAIGDPKSIVKKPFPSGWTLVNPINGISSRAILPMMIFLSTATGYMAITGLLPKFAAARDIAGYPIFWQAAAIGQLFSRSLSGGLSDRFGRGAVIVPMLLLMSVGLITLSIANTVPMLLLAGLIVGLANAGVQTTISALVVDRSNEQDLSSSLATYTLAWDFGAILGQTGFGLLVISLGMSNVFLLLTLLPLGAILLYFRKVR